MDRTRKANLEDFSWLHVEQDVRLLHYLYDKRWVWRAVVESFSPAPPGRLPALTMSLRVVRVRPSPSLPSLVLARSSTRVQGLRNAFLNVRHNTSAAAPQQPVWRRLPTVFSALLVVGVCSTAFGL
jgi:hypothetical protein